MVLQKVTLSVLQYFVCGVLLFVEVSGKRNTSEHELLDFLFKEHNRQARPVKDPNRNITVTITANVMSLLNVDERRQSIEIRGWMDLGWQDEFLVWNDTIFSDIDMIFVDPSMVWLPDLCIYNSYSNHNDIVMDKTRVLIYSNGSMRWYPGGVYKTSCKIRIKYYPFDTQICYIKVSQRYTVYGMQIEKTESDIVQINTHNSENTEWQIEGSRALCETMDNDDACSVECVFSLSLKRRPFYYAINIISPAILLSYLICFSFMIPNNSGEKLQFAVTLFLAYSFVIDQIDDKLPVSSLEFCYFAMLTKGQYFFGAIQTCVIIFIVHVSARPAYLPRGKIYLWITNLIIIKSLSRKCQNIRKDNIKPDRLGKARNTTRDVKGNVFNDVTWEHVACALDKISLYISLLLNTVAIAIYVILLLHNYSFLRSSQSYAN